MEKLVELNEYNVRVKIDATCNNSLFLELTNKSQPPVNKEDVLLDFMALIDIYGGRYAFCFDKFTPRFYDVSGDLPFNHVMNIIQSYSLMLKGYYTTLYIENLDRPLRPILTHVLNSKFNDFDEEHIKMRIINAINTYFDAPQLCSFDDLFGG